MNKNYDNEDFLTKWVANELTEEEKTEFESSEAYRQLMVIDRETANLKGPDIDTEKALATVKRRLTHSKKEVPVRRLWWVASIAAAIAILFGTYTFLFGTKTYSTGIGERETILLADGSSVILNANSSLSYQRYNWVDDRKVRLNGEGYFDIRSGKGFTVQTSKGDINVLGTKFNVRDRKNLKVQCYEGSISFIPLNDNLEPINLLQGMQLELSDSQLRTHSLVKNTPDWQNGFSSFSQRPFIEVLEELAVQYPISFDVGSVKTDRLFTGQFTHDNLESALKSTMQPMGITYMLSKDKRIVTLSN